MTILDCLTLDLESHQNIGKNIAEPLNFLYKKLVPVFFCGLMGGGEGWKGGSEYFSTYVTFYNASNYT